MQIKSTFRHCIKSFVFLKMIFGLVVFELDVKTLLDADLHLDWVVHLGVGGQRLHRQIKLLVHYQIRA